MNEVCEVCCGRRVVRLPIHDQKANIDNYLDAPVERRWRHYPCPQCARIEGVAEADVLVIERSITVSEHSLLGPGVLDEIYKGVDRQLLLMLVDRLAESGYVDIGREKVDPRHTKVTASIHCISRADFVRLRARSRGRVAYERDCELAPTYPNGEARKTWAELGDTARRAWENRSY